MLPSASAKFRRSRGKMYEALTATLLTLCLAGCFSDAQTRAQIDLVEVFSSSSDPDWPYLDAEDNTAELCQGSTKCVQAVRNQYLSILKFASVTEAASYVSSCDCDAHQVDPIVVVFDGQPLDDSLKESIVDGVKGIHVDFPD